MFGIIGTVLKLVPPKVALVVGLVVISAYSGWYVRGLKADQEQLEAVSRAIKQANAQHDIDMEIFKDSVEAQKKVEIRYVKIKEDAEDVGGLECTGNVDDWLRVYNDAIRATGSTTPYQ